MHALEASRKKPVILCGDLNGPRPGQGCRANLSIYPSFYPSV